MTQRQVPEGGVVYPSNARGLINVGMREVMIASFFVCLIIFDFVGE